MADIVNLNRARKAKARAAAKGQAAANRVAFGRTKAEKEADGGERRRLDHLLDAAKLEE